MKPGRPLQNITVVVTRPAGTASPLARRIRHLGGVPVTVPGLTLRAIEDSIPVAAALGRALTGDIVVFTSPAAVRFAAAIAPLTTTATVIAVGFGTANALRLAGLPDAICSDRSQDSEGVLALPELANVTGRRVALIGAPGGRGLLRAQLAARGADLDEVHVYHRGAPRLDGRHIDPLLKLTRRSMVLLSSAEALGHLQRALVPSAWRKLVAAVAVVSSERMREAASAAGFERIAVARSARPADLVEAAARFDFTHPERV
ncbi:uroporphyrinogen-III synthase [Luteibacter rhizovicinus]|uniref:Uroporphyrinogen-III synthase n=1 Tax=Luteibacter rhizovicinus TaxID=242606 RepID=A0A4R3YU62_9GAMM|nr:uroporphyrinogen-III synthase [Luteibacter rhizovicinus]TCV96060.1 uroporphyrinogen-III synthase [Luteibacter rhizovicinus]